MKIIGYALPQAISMLERMGNATIHVYACPTGQATVPVYLNDGEKEPTTPAECAACIGRLQQEIIRLTQKITGDPTGVITVRLGE